MVQPGARHPEMHVRHFRVLVKSALHEVGLGNLQQAMDSFLEGTAARMLTDHSVDLGPLWQVMSRDAGISPQQASQVLFLIGLYLDNHAHVAVIFPQEARPVMEAALPQVGYHLEGQLQRVVATVAERLLDPEAGPRPSGEDDNGPGAPDALPVEETRRRRGLVRGLVLLAVLCSIVAAVQFEAERRRAGWQAWRMRVDRAALSRLVPVQRARISGPALILLLRDDSFGRLPAQRQLRLGRQLFSAMGRDDILTIFLTGGLSSGAARYRLDRRDGGPDGVIDVTPLSVPPGTETAEGPR